MRVNVDEKALSDPRITRAGARLNMHPREVLGRLVAVWMNAYSTRSAIMKTVDVDALSERKGFAKVLVAVDLAQTRGKFSVRLRGVEDRIEFLLVQDRKRSLANAARLGRPRDAPPGKLLDGDESNKAGVPREVPGQGPNTLTPAPSLTQPPAPTLGGAEAVAELLLALPPAPDGWKPPAGGAAVGAMRKRIAAGELTIAQCVRITESFNGGARGEYKNAKHRDNALSSWTLKHDPSRSGAGDRVEPSADKDYAVPSWMKSNRRPQ